MVDDLLQKFTGKELVESLYLLITTSVVCIGKAQIEQIDDVGRLREMCYRFILTHNIEEQLKKVKDSLTQIN